MFHQETTQVWSSLTNQDISLCLTSVHLLNLFSSVVCFFFVFVNHCCYLDVVILYPSQGAEP